MSHHPATECSLFEAAVERIDHWGRKFVHPLLIMLGLSAVSFAAIGKVVPELKPWVPWILSSALGVLFLTYGVSQGLLAKAISELFDHSELADLPDNSPDRQQWCHRWYSAHRGMQNGLLAGAAVFVGIVLEAFAMATDRPPLWYGALPAAFALFLISARFFHQEHRAAPEQLATTIRQMMELRRKAPK